ncbi:MAG: hypothetical protein KAS90_02460 [Candidatus Aenigmarchaeota archaeon]|nr:hypothetical protein [Candidatus Aenigmarchaeota archaeon]
MENNKAKKESDTNTIKKKSKKDYTSIIVAIILLSVFIIFGFIMQSQYSNNRAIEQCLAIENHPDLAYPCICYPSEKPEDIDPFVDKNTEKYCLCKCDIGNNQTYTAYIIRAID